MQRLPQQPANELRRTWLSLGELQTGKFVNSFEIKGDETRASAPRYDAELNTAFCADARKEARSEGGGAEYLLESRAAGKREIPGDKRGKSRLPRRNPVVSAAGNAVNTGGRKKGGAMSDSRSVAASLGSDENRTMTNAALFRSGERR
ncbi:hypothetical protein KM043_010961 [Ampulex compressa]|nr:hypothetical protein KM043_010961 [Ampulex compressa]